MLLFSNIFLDGPLIVFHSKYISSKKGNRVIMIKILKVQNKDLRFILQSFAKCLKKVRVYPAFNLHDNELIDKFGNY